MINEDSKKILLSVFGIALLLIAVMGVSYAVYVYVSKSYVKNVLTTGTISMDYIESEDSINITDATVIDDESGKKQSEYFDFTVTSLLSANAKINYDVVVEAIDVENQINPNNIKLYLEKESSGQYEQLVEPIYFNINNGKKMNLYTGVFKNDTNKVEKYVDKYRLRMWLGSTEGLDGTHKKFKLKVNVNAST